MPTTRAPTRRAVGRFSERSGAGGTASRLAPRSRRTGHRPPDSRCSRLTILSYHVSAGNFERADRGLYRIPTLPPSEHDDLLRLWLWSRGRDDQPQAVVSHQTALDLHGLAELIPTRIHLTVPPAFRRPAPEGCTLHKGVVEEADTQEMASLRVTTPLRTLRDLADDPSLPAEQLERAVEEAASRGLIRRSQVTELLARSATAVIPIESRDGPVR